MRVQEEEQLVKLQQQALQNPEFQKLMGSPEFQKAMQDLEVWPCMAYRIPYSYHSCQSVPTAEVPAAYAQAMLHPLHIRYMSCTCAQSGFTCTGLPVPVASARPLQSGTAHTRAFQ